MVSTRHFIFKSSSPCTNTLVMFHGFFDSQARSRYLFLSSHSFNFSRRSARTAEFTILPVLLFLLIILIRSGCLAEIWRYVCISKSQRSLCVSFSRTDSGLCTYHLFIWSNFNFLHNSQWITLPTQSCLVLYSFCANLLHSLIMWLMVSFLSPHDLCLLFCFVYSWFDMVSPCGVVLCCY